MTTNRDALKRQNRQLYLNLRNYLLTATAAQAAEEVRLSESRGDHVRAELINELIDTGFFDD